MSAQDVRERYKVPAALNMRIKVRGATGVIAGFEGPRLLVMMDGEKYLQTIHPVLGVTYPAAGEVFPVVKKRESHLSLVPDAPDGGDPSGPRKPGRTRKVKSDVELGLEPLPVDDPNHGTVDGYRKYKCKCEPCRAAWRERCRAEKAARLARKLDPDDPRHGSSNFYSNYGCRCRPCTDAMYRLDTRAVAKGTMGSRPECRRPRPGEAQAELQAAHSEVTGIEQREIAS